MEQYITKYYANRWRLEVEEVKVEQLGDNEFVADDLAFYTNDELFDSEIEAYRGLERIIEENIKELRQKQDEILDILIERAMNKKEA